MRNTEESQGNYAPVSKAPTNGQNRHDMRCVDDQHESNRLDYQQALRRFCACMQGGERDKAIEASADMKSWRKELDWRGQELLPESHIVGLGNAAAILNADELKKLGVTLQNYLTVQSQLRDGTVRSVEENLRLFGRLNQLGTALDPHWIPRWRHPLRQGANIARHFGVTAAEHTLGWLGRWTDGVVLALRNENGMPWHAVRSRIARLIESFFSYQALRQTGVETSWGLRTYVPGTYGLAGNVGPWIMMYSGTVSHYAAHDRPMRINPGATFATPFWVATWNRPGLGAGASLPFASTYIDSARYKLLFGIDGVGYVRVGEWRGRGPYLTVSASIPVWFGVSVTWNFSLFSPGFAPLVKHSTPIANKLREWTSGMVRRARRLLPR